MGDAARHSGSRLSGLGVAANADGGIVDGGVAGICDYRFAGSARLLSPLYGGRAFPGNHRTPAGTGPRDGRFGSEFFAVMEDGGAVRPVDPDHAAARHRQKHAGRQPYHRQSAGFRKRRQETGLEPEEKDEVRFLVEHHLDMSATIQRRDIFDQGTVSLFARTAGTLERLQRLTLLTYADIHAVNPEALTPWKAEMLWQLFVATANHFSRTL